jgi:hypothetical protein
LTWHGADWFNWLIEQLGKISIGVAKRPRAFEGFDPGLPDAGGGLLNALLCLPDALLRCSYALHNRRYVRAVRKLGCRAAYEQDAGKQE